MLIRTIILAMLIASPTMAGWHVESYPAHLLCEAEYLGTLDAEARVDMEAICAVMEAG